ncbi:hypothetical protein NM208_g1209 [Fusarium decemcellulare]|uniref:Uncharacterized protein n=1 Tax=Fusarium decemcellulare TaxID=57161 RepID=A0ACC1SX43_9HYPO|nr:hypothetical protein NM208_g1209 [Fusarium decemcellulare]
MAEILGIVSSVITIVEVAGKLGASTIKLKRLWDEVHDVPASIRRCIEELELLAPAIEEMDLEFQRTRDMVQHDSAARRSVEYSRKAMQTLEILIRDMEGQIASTRKSKKLLAQLKVRLKRDVIEEHQHRLQSALRLVNLSQQTYLIALTRAQPSIIMSELQAMRETELADAPRASLSEKECDSSELEGKQVLAAETSQYTQALTNSGCDRGWWPTVKGIPWKPTGLLGRFTHQVVEPTCQEQTDLDLELTVRVRQIRLQLPYWMTQTAWDLQAYRAYDGWKFHFNSWSARPDNSEIFALVREGNVALVLKAIANNQASLYDRTPSGETLMERTRIFPWGLLERWVSKAVSMWLEDLYEAGVDLEEYIQCEMSVSRVECDVASIAILQPGARLRDLGPSLVVIEHGKRPEDWVVEWDPCIEELSGEFWNVINAPPALPGAWIEDMEDNDFRFEWCHMQEGNSCALAAIRWINEPILADQPQPSQARGIHRCERFQI